MLYHIHTYSITNHEKKLTWISTVWTLKGLCMPGITHGSKHSCRNFSYLFLQDTVGAAAHTEMSVWNIFTDSVGKQQQ